MNDDQVKQAVAELQDVVRCNIDQMGGDITKDLRERMLQAIRKEWAENPKPAGSRIDRQVAEALVEAAIAEMGGVKVEPSRLSDWRELWVEHGGGWHGPRVETWTIREENFCAFMDAAIETAPVSVQKPNMDYCYNRKDWETTFGWDDRDILVENMLPGEVMEVGTLQQGPTLWVVEHENSDGDRETRWFDNETDARALAEGQDDE